MEKTFVVKLGLLLILTAAFALAQDETPEPPPPVTTQVAPLGIPCEPGQPLPLGPGFPVICPPAEEQGFMVFVKTTDADTAAYHITLRYTTADGEQKTADQKIARSQDGDWTVVVFQVGRMKTPDLPGNTADGVDVEQLASLDPDPVSTEKRAKKKK